LRATASERQRVVITGMGAVSALGLDARAMWERLRAGESAIAPLRHPDSAELRVKVAAQVPEEFERAGGLSAEQSTLMDRNSQLALCAAREAEAQSGLDFDRLELARNAAVVVGCGTGGELAHDQQSRRMYGEHNPRVHPFTIVRLMVNAPASHISMAYKLHGPSFVVASACASANHALIQAAQMIRSGQTDVALSGGTEACLSFSCLRAWEAMRILATDTCRPFSAHRSGLVLGEGAAIFVLESLTHARSRSAPILCEFAGGGMSADGADIVLPSAEGEALALERALADAGLNADDVDYVNAHGTGTQANDSTETRALHLAFGDHAKRLAVSSTKAKHGHALGAAGALELVAVIGALREGVVPPTVNLDAPDLECDLDYVPGSARAMPVRAAMSNTFAFGGLNAVLALKRAS
jgi:nodulation protein E